MLAHFNCWIVLRCALRIFTLSTQRFVRTCYVPVHQTRAYWRFRSAHLTGYRQLDRLNRVQSVRARTSRVLYYGNYIPLHGVEILISAIADLSRSTEVHLTLVGDGQTRRSAERLVELLGIGGRCEFLAPTSVAGIVEYIERSQVVAGIFGDSLKAKTVVANKVWQGLSAGRVVITRASPALDELQAIVGRNLIQVDDRTPAAVADALRYLVRDDRPAPGAGAVPARIRSGLASYVSLCFEQLTAGLAGLQTASPAELVGSRR